MANTLTVLGSGVMLPTKKRNASAFLLRTESSTVLLDCGMGTLARLAQSNVDPRSIDAMCISHFHADHFGDAYNLVAARFVGDTYEKVAHSSLHIIGPSGLEDRYKLWRKIYWLESGEEYPLVFSEGQSSYQVGDMKIETFSVKHVPWFQSIGFKITVDHKIIVYPGDVSARGNDYLYEVTRDADWLIVEAGYPHETPNHFTLDAIARLADTCRIKNVLIVHIKPYADEEKRISEFVQKHSNFTIAEDLMDIEL